MWWPVSPASTDRQTRRPGPPVSTRRILVTCAVAVVVLTACRPVAPPAPPPVSQYCAPSVPSSPAQYQAAFDNLRRTYTEWASADGPVPIALPDGRTLWTFGDTWIGKVLADGSITPTNQLEHNSFVVQTGACFAPQMGGTPLRRTERIADPSPGQWYWPASGFVVGSSVHMFLWHLRSEPAPLFFSIVGMAVATLSLPDLTVQSISAQPFAALPRVFYGATATVIGSTVYAYGRADRNGYVARVPITQVGISSAWEFWGNPEGGSPDTWVTNPATAVPMTFSGTPPPLPAFGAGSGPGAPLSVQPYGAGFFGTAKLLDAFSNDVSAFTAPTPAGPWTYHGRIHTTPTVSAGGFGVSSYGALFPFALQGDPGPTIVYSTNDFLFDGVEPPPNIGIYGPRFAAPDGGALPPP